MGNTATRLFVAAGIVLGTWGIGSWLHGSMKPRQVELPAWDFRDMPLQLGPWRGVDTELDPKIVPRIGAAKDPSSGEDKVVERVYQDESLHTIKLHTAIFDDPDTGIYHSPINCYRSSGFEKIKESTLDLQVGEEGNAAVSYSVWEGKDGKRKLVVYWFQLDEYFVFDRFQMAGVHWRMRGRTTWPALIKVLMETEAQSADDLEGDQARLRDLAERVFRWTQEALAVHAAGAAAPAE